MNTHADKTQENKSQSVANELSQKQSGCESSLQFVDNRPEAVAQRKNQEMANNSPQAKQATQLQAMADNHSAQQQQPIQKKENNTGLPDNLKTGMENISGMFLVDVKVHRNLDKPAQLQAHAYAQGTDIHLGQGQEKHLPHEAWHVVQQKQGHVKPTMQMMGKVNVNDDAGLEKEADVMGAKAFATDSELTTMTPQESVDINSSASLIQKKDIEKNKLNVVGERHPESNPRRPREKDFIVTKGIPREKYWKENDYKYTIKETKLRLFGKDLWTNTQTHFGDPAILRVEKRIGDTKEKLLPLVADFEQGKHPEDWKGQGMSLNVAWNAFTKHGITKEIKQLLLTMHELFEVSAEQKFAAKLIPLYEHLETNYNEYDSRQDVLDVQKDATAFIQMWTKAENIFSNAVKGGKPLSPFDEVDQQRSDEMDKGAKASGDTQGVWKVGQSHINDIKGKQGFDEKALNYNILTRDEFNSRFEPWEQREKDKKGGLTLIPGEEIRDIPVPDPYERTGVVEEINLPNN